MRVQKKSFCFFFCAILVILSGCVRTCSDYSCLRDVHAQSDNVYLQTELVLPEEGLTLEECMAIAAEQNFDVRLKAWETAIQRETACREVWNMLPALEVEFLDNGRNNNPGSSSQSLVPGVPPAPPSVSSEKNSQHTRVELAWNLLDFGVSYLLSKQEKSQALIYQLEGERIKQNTLLKVVEEFWVAASAKQAIEGSLEILDRAERLKIVIDRMIDQRILPAISGLNNIDILVDIELRLQEYQKIYDQSLSRLTGLMGLPPNRGFTIKIPEKMLPSPELELIASMEQIALYNRPELYMKDLEGEIAYYDVELAKWRMIPGIEFFCKYDSDSNKFLIEREWLTAGLAILKDIFELPINYKDKVIGEYNRQRNALDRLNASLGIVAQVNIAALEYLENQKRLRILEEKKTVTYRLLDSARKSHDQGEFDEFELIQYEISALIAKVEETQAYGELMTSLERVNNSMGLPGYYHPAKEIGLGGCL